MILKDIKRIISQFFETEYWYRFRSLTSLWYDDEDQKYYKCSSLNKARDIITSTWEGENDILNIMILKIDQMFWSLKKYGVEKNYYIYENDIFKHRTEEDKKIILTGALKETLTNDKKIWLFSGETPKSVNGKCDFYIKYDNVNFEIVVYCNIYKNGKQKKYEVGKEIVLQEYEMSDTDNVGDFVVSKLDSIFYAINVFVEAENMPPIEITNLGEYLITKLDTYLYYGFPMKDVCRLSKELRQQAVGNFVKCKDLLHLRRLIKNILKIDDLNPKYNTWQNYKGEEKKKKLKECNELYMSDRKEAYRRMADFMAEKGLRWWD